MKRIKQIAAMLLCMVLLLPVLNINAAEKDDVMIKAGKEYSIMNCDTGRLIRAVNREYFRLEAVDGGYYLSDSDGGYYRFDGGILKKSDIKQRLIIKKHEYGRYTLSTANGRYFTDDDSGDDSTAVIGNANDAKYIEAYWYFTERGERAPIKIMPLGDSLTNGENADIPTEERCGYRGLISSLIAENAPNLRFVFVGSQRSGGTAYGNSSALYRHEGHNGYVINDIYGKAPPHYGIAQSIMPWLKKYRPDAVIMMLGTNDVGLSWESGDLSMIERIAENWESLVKTVLNAIPDGGIIVVASVPPIKNGELFNAWAKRLNSNLISLSRSLDSESKEVVFSDVNTAVYENGLSDSFCSDGGHFNESGYAAVGNKLYESIAASRTFRRLLSEHRTENSESTDIMSDTVHEKQIATAWLLLASLGAITVITAAVIVSAVKKKRN